MVLKGEKTGITKKFDELCRTVCQELSLEVYDLDYINGSQTLRVFIIDPETGSAVIEDCMKVDRALTPYIDEEEWMPEELTLEVSSPGIYRALNCKEHFENSVGSDLELSIMGKLNEEEFPGLPKKLTKNSKFIAKLESLNGDGIEVVYEDYKINLKYEQIKKACIEPSL